MTPIEIKRLIKPSEVDSETMACARLLVHTNISVYLEHAGHVHQVPTNTRTSKVIDEVIVNKTLPTHSASASKILQTKLINALKKSYSTYEELGPAIDLLIEYYYLEILPYAGNTQHKKEVITLRPTAGCLSGIYIDARHDGAPEGFVLFTVNKSQYVGFGFDSIRNINLRDTNGGYLFCLEQYGINRPVVKKIYECEKMDQYEADNLIGAILGIASQKHNFSPATKTIH